MGANDAAEMLEVAKEEVGRLERELEAEKRSSALAEKHWHRDQADLAIIVGQRDAALAVIERIRDEIKRGEHPDDWGVQCVYTKSLHAILTPETPADLLASQHRAALKSQSDFYREHPRTDDAGRDE